MKKLIHQYSIVALFFYLFAGSYAIAKPVALQDVTGKFSLGSNLEETKYYYLIDADTKEILLSKNADDEISPSSMTKVMTAYVALDEIEKGNLSFDSQCVVGMDAWRKSGSTMFLNHGDVVTIRKLIRGLLSVSGNDAAVALAQSSAKGGFNEFIDLMNDKARELGMNHSHFQNPHGLYEDKHYMSVRDLGTLAVNFCQNFPQYLHLLRIPQFTYGNITQRNRNPLMKEDYEGTLGGKTGHTNDGGYGVVGIVKRDHRRLVGVINKARTPSQRSSAIIELFDYGFNNFKKIVLFKEGQNVAQLKVWLGDKRKVGVVTNQKIAFTMPQNKSLDDVKIQVNYLGPFYPTIKKGDKIANLMIKVDGYKTLKYPLFAQENIAKAGYFSRVNQILRYKISHFLL